ncbi:MAG: Lrp/AsnC family transcriptional regulator [archaeon]
MRKEKIETPAYVPGITYGKRYNFDKYDKLILKELDQNARKQFSDMAKKVGLSRDAIKHRIEKMINSKVILAFKPIYDQSQMGFVIVNYVCISLYNPSPEKEKEFLNYMKNQKNITYIASLTGKWDYIIDIMAENPGHFDQIMKGIRQKFPELIKDYEIYGVLNEFKYEELGRLIYD